MSEQPGHYNTPLICESGHIITASLEWHPERQQKFCQKCGGRAWSVCPNCKAAIRGQYSQDASDVFGSGEPWLDIPPAYCHNCGIAYPWTRRAIREVREAAKGAMNLTEDGREELAAAAETVLRQTPGNDRAAARVKELLQKAGSEVYEIAKEVLTRLVTEATLKQMGF